MTLTFKKLYDQEETYYELDLGSTSSCGEFMMHCENNPEKGVMTGNMIRLHRIWKSGEYSNYTGDVYVTPLLFESEFYPAIYNIEGEVQKRIKEANQARIDKMYESPVENALLDTVNKELGEGENNERD